MIYFNIISFTILYNVPVSYPEDKGTDQRVLNDL